MSSPTRDLPIKQCRSHVTKYSCCNLLPENGMSHFFVGVYLSSRKRLDDEEAKKNATLTESFPQNPIWLVEQIFGGGSSTRNNATQPKSSIFISAVLFFVDSCLLYLFLFWSVVVASFALHIPMTKVWIYLLCEKSTKMRLPSFDFRHVHDAHCTRFDCYQCSSPFSAFSTESVCLSKRVTNCTRVKSAISLASLMSQ